MKMKKKTPTHKSVKQKEYKIFKKFNNIYKMMEMNKKFKEYKKQINHKLKRIKKK